MSAILPFDQVADELTELIRSGETALVIGAGASLASGAPLSAALVDGMRQRFPLAEIKEDSGFLDAGNEVCDTPPYGRVKLVRYVKEVLGGLLPSASHRQLPRACWTALFTTNYDDLIEKAYESPGRVQSLQRINLPYSGNVLPRAGHTLLFYLQGSILEPEESSGSPVVSWSDYLQTVQQRQAAMDTFRNIIVNGGNVIYLGYSFGDRFLDDLLDEAARRIGNRNMPYGYAILAEWPPKRASAAARVVRRFITPVEGTFEQFAALIDRVSSDQSKGQRSKLPTPATGRHLQLATGLAELSEGDAAVISEFFEVLDEELVASADITTGEEKSLARAFLKGETLGWQPFVKDWAFKRTAYQDLWDIVNVHRQSDSAESEIVLVHGAAGLGKSVMARQLALDLYRSGRPTLLAKPLWRSRPDLAILERALQDIEDGLPDNASLPPAVLIVDEAEIFDHTVAPRILRNVQNAGRIISIVLFARTNEYFRIEKSATGAPPEKWGHPQELHVPEKITDGEVRSLVRHIARLNLWDGRRVTDEAFWLSHVQINLQSSFFDTVYSLVEQTQEPLEQRVWTEFEHLSATAKDAYLLIASTHQFGLPLKMEMLVRALGVSFSDFEEKVIHSDAREVLFSDYETNELNIFYRGRTRLVSQIVFERALPDRRAQLDMFKKVVGAASPSSMFGVEEIELVRSLLVQVLGPAGHDSRFTAPELAELFEIATGNLEDDVLEHHYGLIERAADRLESARTHLEKALSLSRTAIGAREAIQNIENSLAQVTGDLAIRSARAGDLHRANELFDEASRLFVTARTGEFPNAAAYDAHARLLMRRAKALYPADSSERALGLSEALDVVAAGIDNVNEEHKAELAELRATTLTELGLGDVAIDEVRTRAETLKGSQRARYEVLIARMIINASTGDSRKALERALPHAVLATECDGSYFEGWRMRAELYKGLHPTDFAATSDLLKKATECQAAQGNLWVLYELGIAYFYLRRYSDSSQIFDRLRRSSRGSSYGLAILERAGEREEEDEEEFDGRLVRRVTDGRVGIACEELRDFGDLWFNPRRQRYYEPRVGDRVSFVVGFNYKGLQALDLRKV